MKGGDQHIMVDPGPGWGDDKIRRGLFCGWRSWWGPAEGPEGRRPTLQSFWGFFLFGLIHFEIIITKILTGQRIYTTEMLGIQIDWLTDGWFLFLLGWWRTRLYFFTQKLQKVLNHILLVQMASCKWKKTNKHNEYWTNMSVGSTLVQNRGKHNPQLESKIPSLN